ncbi:MAG: D-aminoacyl-tRNA deacylase [Granulosicoccaceae bacterium]
MIGLLQRVTQGQVDVAGVTIGRTGPGLLVLLGVEAQDDEAKAERLVERLLGYRVFSDEQGRMNLSLLDISGGLLLVPQFTLAADTKKGRRPSFACAAPPDLAEDMFQRAVEIARRHPIRVETGQFGADMQVSLCNDGPVTFWLQV